MEQRRLRRTRALPARLRDFLVEGASSALDPAAVVRLDHTYSRVSVSGLEERHVKNAAILPDLRPAVTVSSEDAGQQTESLSIHGCSVEDYQDIYRSVVEPMRKNRCGHRRPYSLQLGLDIKQRLWEALGCPVVEETEQADGRIVITESRSGSSIAPRIQVDISEEPLPEEPRRKRSRH